MYLTLKRLSGKKKGYRGSSSCIYLSLSLFPPPLLPTDSSTSENLAIFIWQQLSQSLGDKGHLLYEVLIEETPNNTFVYRGELKQL